MTSTTTDIVTDKPTFDYHQTSYRYNEMWHQSYVNEYTIKDQIKQVTLPYRSAIKQGYVRTGVKFHCQQNCGQDKRGKLLWQYEATAIVKHINAARTSGRDVVAVTHGVSHPLPDTVCTYIYERKV